MEKIITEQAPKAIGPYSQGVIMGRLVFTSGQIAIDPETGTLSGDISAQAEQCCKNVAAILKAAGTDTANVLKTTCFLQNMGDFTAFNAVYERHFPGNPARSCVAVSALPKGALCEIEAIAQIK